MPDRSRRLLTFVWDGMPSALPAEVVVSASDNAAIGELPVPLGELREVAVQGHTLYPLIRDPSQGGCGRSTTLFVQMHDHVAALLICGDIDLRAGMIEQDLLAQFDDGSTAVILDIEEILLSLIRHQEA